MSSGSGIIGGGFIHVCDVGYFDFLLWGPRWSTSCTLIHDGGCAKRDYSLVHLCGYRLTLCNVYNKWEIVEIMGVAHIK